MIYFNPIIYLNDKKKYPLQLILREILLMANVDFTKAAAQLCRNYLTELRGDVSHFCKMFDYRNNGEDADWGNSRDSIERAVWFLTSREPK